MVDGNAVATLCTVSLTRQDSIWFEDAPMDILNSTFVMILSYLKF